MAEITSRLSNALADRYRIERHLGEGGMATVYLAEDLKHQRKVAVKVLRPELAAVLGAERFVQEITTTANLQHPHILPLFNSGEADSFLYYVMPFIDGETLRDKLDRETQLGIAEAVKITTEIADALDYAHRNNVIHRDIKPENILLHDGRPMVADFGIALAVSAAAGGRMTETGLSLGTPHYMSPEQATAEKDLTHRSDIYSLGSVLYEMLTGEPPHTGASAQAIIMKIVTDAPRPVTELRHSVPDNVGAAVAQSLEKLAADRFESAKTFSDALSDPHFTFGNQRIEGAGRSGGTRNITVGLSIAAVVLFVVALLGWTRPGPGVPAVSRWVLGLPEVPRQINEWGPSVAISNDGRHVAYLGSDTANTWEAGNWWIRSLENLQPRWMHEYAEYAAFSPDGRSMAFRTGAYLGEIRIKSIEGDRREMLADSAGSPGIDWGADGWIYYQHRRTERGGLARVRPGGEIEVLTTVGADSDEYHGWPHALPNGRGVIFTIARWGRYALSEREIAVLDLETLEIRQLVHANYARYAESGHLLFIQADGSLFAAPFDQDRFAVTGESVRLLDNVSFNGGMRGAELDISVNGTLIYVTSADADLDEVVFATRGGVVQEVYPGWGGRVRYPAASPDGARIAATVFRERGPPNVFIMTLETGELQRLTYGILDYQARWIDNGERIAFVGPRPPERTDWDLYATTVGPGLEEMMLHAPGEITQADFTSAGDWVVFQEESSGRYDLWATQFTGDSTRVAVAATSAQESSPRFSPDDRFVAFTSDQTGRREVWVRRFGSEGRPLQVSLEGGDHARWSPLGDELFYVDAEGDLVSARFNVETAFSVVERRSLFSMADYKQEDYDVLRDGRFLLIRRRIREVPGQVVLVENFFEELRTRVGN